jgi:thiosulfate/3-mercaptopyruvate sulfurtransferase
VIDARREDDYQRGHIPEAIWLGWERWCEPAPAHASPVLQQQGYWGVLREARPQEYGGLLAARGVSSDRPIVVYGDGPRTRGRDGRIAWMLLYLGAPAVLLLDGGWSGWLACGGRSASVATQVRPGHFTVDVQHQRRRTLSELRLILASGTLPRFVDTRSHAEFDGDVQAYLPRRGHLPGATLVPFTTLFDTQDRFVGKDAYHDFLPPTLLEASDIVSYCEVGVRASLFSLLHEIYTGQVVPVYDGSLMQWSLEGEPLDVSSYQ